MVKRFTLGNGLFGAAKLTKNVDPDKYGYISLVLDSIQVLNFHYQTVAGVRI